MESYDPEHINSDDAQYLMLLGKDIKALIDGGNLTDAERISLTEDAADIAAMQKIITDTEAEIKRISDAVDGYDLVTVTSDDKADLEQLLADINVQLDPINLAEEEIFELKHDKKVVEDLLSKIKGTYEMIDKLPENITKNYEDAIKAVDDAYDSLTNYEKSFVDVYVNKALDYAKAALSELNKPADPNFPQIGDNSHIALWIAMLFINGGAVIILIVVDRKRRMVSKR